MKFGQVVNRQTNITILRTPPGDEVINQIKSNSYSALSVVGLCRMQIGGTALWR